MIRRSWWPVLVLTLFAAAFSAPAPAAEPAGAATPAGRIAISLGSGGAILVGPADGSDWRIAASGLDPALSPDGGRLAYARWGIDPGIYIQDLASGEARRVAEANQGRGPVWSPDGSRIAFYERRDGLERIPPFRNPVRVDHWVITIVEPGSGERFQVPTDRFPKAPSWSADGRQLVVQGQDGLSIVDAAWDGPRPARIPGTTPEFAQPEWSPAGDQIAAMVRQTNQWAVVVLGVAGGTRVISDPDVEAQIDQALNWPFAAPIDSVSPAWSPDGRWVAFAAKRDGAWGIYRTPVDGGPVEALAAAPIVYRQAGERLVSWSADPGRPIAGAPWQTPPPPADLAVSVVSIEPSPIAGITRARAVVRTEPGAEVRVEVRYCGGPALTGDLQGARLADENGLVTWNWIAVPGMCHGPGTFVATATQGGRSGRVTATFPIE